jgi:hypothetical protein
MSLTPSPARRLTVPRRDATPRGFVPSAMPLRWPDKEPGAILDYSLDIQHLLDPGDTLSAFSAAVTPSVPGGLVVDSVLTSGTVATAWLGDGVADVDYTVMLSLSSLSGRYVPVTVRLLVNNLTSI